MYFEGVDDKYILIKCDKCRHLLKFYKQYLASYDDEHCVVNTPLQCSCGNKSTLEIYKETEEEKEKRCSTPIEEANQVHCPKCGSTQITANKKGFGLGKAVVGTVLTGGLWGAGAGFMGSNKVILTCLKCGKQWKAGK